MAVKRRKYSRDFKLQVVREVAAGKSQAQLAREHELHPNLIARWYRQHQQYKDRAFAGPGHAYTEEARLAALERMVGRLTMENDLLKKALQQLEDET